MGYGKPKAQQKKRKDPEWDAAMAKIRRTHICVRCGKYPGDNDYIFGTMNADRVYTCYEC